MKIVHKSKEVESALVKGWDKNPLDISAEDFNRLKAQIEAHGLYKPLICVKEGLDYIVVGGNMRLKVLKALHVNPVWITQIEVKDEKEKLEISLSDNDRAGFYKEDELRSQASELGVDLIKFNVGIELPVLELETLKEKTEGIRYYKRTHVLLSFDPALLLKIEPLLKKIIEVDGVSYETSSN